MNFLEAVKAMKEGKKVRRLGWYKARYIQFSDDNLLIQREDGEEEKFDIWEYEATDWEIYKEKKTLSNMIMPSGSFIGEMLPIENVKQSLKEFIDWCENKKIDDTTHRQKAKEIFGSRLIE